MGDRDATLGTGYAGLHAACRHQANVKLVCSVTASSFDLDEVMENVVIYRALGGDIARASAFGDVSQVLEAEPSETLFKSHACMPPNIP